MSPKRCAPQATKVQATLGFQSRKRAHQGELAPAEAGVASELAGEAQVVTSAPAEEAKVAVASAAAEEAKQAAPADEAKGVVASPPATPQAETDVLDLMSDATAEEPQEAKVDMPEAVLEAPKEPGSSLSTV